MKTFKSDNAKYQYRNQDSNLQHTTQNELYLPLTLYPASMITALKEYIKTTEKFM
jgi:hypothetical protein